MSNMFSKLTTDGLEETSDRVGGFSVLESKIYDVKIKAMFAGVSSGGAQSMTLIATLPDGKEYRETFYMTNKKGENWFPNKQDPTKKVPLPGFTVVNDICLAATGEPLSAQTVEDKIFNVWDSEARKELPKTVPMLVDVISQPVSLGILNELRNKSEKVGNDYVDIAETRNANIVDKVFHTESHVTMTEAIEGKEAGFWDVWSKANDGAVRDRRTIKDGQAAAQAAGAPKSGGAPAGEKKSLFPKK